MGSYAWVLSYLGLQVLDRIVEVFLALRWCMSSVGVRFVTRYKRKEFNCTHDVENRDAEYKYWNNKV